MNSADEIVRALREMLPPKIDYAELVGAEGFTHGSCYVWDDPVPYIINDAANLIESLQTDLARVTAERDAAVCDLYTACKTSPCNNGICVHKNCSGNRIPCEFEWRGLQQAGEDSNAK